MAALTPTLVLITLLSLSVYLFGDSSSSGPNQIALLIAAAVAAIIGAVSGLTWAEIEESIKTGIGVALGALLILLAVGSLIGSWMLSGTVPTMIYYGLQILDPGYFYFAVCVVCAMVSISIGSSWTTAATIGVAFVGMSKALGLPPEITAGAIISGSYFGDKMSPLSDTTNLASAVVGTELFLHIRNMMWTTIPGLVLSLVFFALLGAGIENEPGSLDIATMLDRLDSLFVITPWTLAPLAILLVMAIRRLPALPTIVAGIAAGCLVALVFQRDSTMRFLGDRQLGSWLDQLQAIWIVLFDGYSIRSGDPMLDELLGRGGMASMLQTIWLIISAMVFGSIMEKTGLLGALVRRLLGWAASTGSLIMSVVMTCISINILAADQYIAIVLPGRMYKLEFERRGLDGLNLSRTLEDAGTLTSPLVPWNTCGAYMAATLGVATFAYLPYCMFNLLCPLIAILFGWTGWRILPAAIQSSRS